MNFKNVNKNQKKRFANAKKNVKNNIHNVNKTKMNKIKNVKKNLKNLNLNANDNQKSKNHRQNKPVFMERFSAEISRYLIWNVKLIISFNNFHVKLIKLLLWKNKFMN